MDVDIAKEVLGGHLMDYYKVKQEAKSKVPKPLVMNALAVNDDEDLPPTPPSDPESQPADLLNGQKVNIIRNGPIRTPGRQDMQRHAAPQQPYVVATRSPPTGNGRTVNASQINSDASRVIAALNQSQQASRPQIVALTNGHTPIVTPLPQLNNKPRNQKRSMYRTVKEAKERERAEKRKRGSLIEDLVGKIFSPDVPGGGTTSPSAIPLLDTAGPAHPRLSPTPGSSTPPPVTIIQYTPDKILKTLPEDTAKSHSTTKSYVVCDIFGNQHTYHAALLYKSYPKIVNDYWIERFTRPQHEASVSTVIRGKSSSGGRKKKSANAALDALLQPFLNGNSTVPKTVKEIEKEVFAKMKDRKCEHCNRYFVSSKRMASHGDICAKRKRMEELPLIQPIKLTNFTPNAPAVHVKPMTPISIAPTTTTLKPIADPSHRLSPVPPRSATQSPAPTTTSRPISPKPPTPIPEPVKITPIPAPPSTAPPEKSTPSPASDPPVLTIESDPDDPMDAVASPSSDGDRAGMGVPLPTSSPGGESSGSWIEKKKQTDADLTLKLDRIKRKNDKSVAVANSESVKGSQSAGEEKSAGATLLAEGESKDSKDACEKLLSDDARKDDDDRFDCDDSPILGIPGTTTSLEDLASKLLAVVNGRADIGKTDSKPDSDTEKDESKKLDSPSADASENLDKSTDQAGHVSVEPSKRKWSKKDMCDLNWNPEPGKLALIDRYCKSCRKVVEMGKVPEHVMENHTLTFTNREGEERYFCLYCHTYPSFRKKSFLMNHVKNCVLSKSDENNKTGKIHICECCRLGFTSINAYEKHTLRCRDYICLVCKACTILAQGKEETDKNAYKFEDELALENHWRVEHASFVGINYKMAYDEEKALQSGLKRRLPGFDDVKKSSEQGTKELKGPVGDIQKVLEAALNASRTNSSSSQP